MFVKQEKPTTGRHSSPAGGTVALKTSLCPTAKKKEEGQLFTERSQEKRGEDDFPYFICKEQGKSYSERRDFTGSHPSVVCREIDQARGKE